MRIEIDNPASGVRQFEESGAARPIRRSDDDGFLAAPLLDEDDEGVAASEWDEGQGGRWWSS
jgi:hypothetical protein